MGLSNNLGKISNTFTSNGTQITLGGSTVTDSHLLNIIGSSATSNIGVVLNKTNSTAQIWGITNVGALTFYDYTAAAERMRITTTGNVGIGTSSPSRRLSVASDGTNWISGVFGGTGNSDVVVIGNLSGATIGGHNSTLTAWAPLLINPDGGNVGIGTRSPSSYGNLTVVMPDASNGTGIVIKARNDGGSASQPALTYLNGSGNYIAQIVADNGTGYLAFNTSTSNTEKMRITSGGEVGIGVAPTGGNRFWVKGNDSTSSNTTLVLQNSGGNNVMIARNDGVVTKSLQPAFRAGRQGSYAPGANTTLVFNYTGGNGFNIGSNYSTSTGRFTAPVAGRYIFDICIIWESVPNGTGMDDAFTIKVNGSINAYSFRRAAYVANTTGISGYYTDFMSIQINLSASDYVEVVNRFALTVHGNENYCWFSGYLLG